MAEPLTCLKKVAAILALSWPLAPHGAFAESSPRQALISALEAEGCLLTIDAMETISLATGIERKALQNAARGLLNEGAISAPNNEIIYLKIGETCANFRRLPIDANPLIVRALLQKFEQENCQLPFNERKEWFVERFLATDVEEAVFTLMNSGSVMIGSKFVTLTTGKVCGAE